MEIEWTSTRTKRRASRRAACASISLIGLLSVLFVVAGASSLRAQCAQNNLPREVSTPDLLQFYRMSFWQVRRSRNPQDLAGIGTATVIESYPDEGRILLLTASHVTQSSFGLDPPSDGSHPSPNPSTLYLFNPASSVPLEAKEVASGNPNKLDIAILEARTTDQALLRAMTPIGIQLSRPRVGSNLRLVGFPANGTNPFFDGDQRQVGSYDPNVEARFYSSIGQGFAGQSGSLAIDEKLPTAIAVYKGPEPSVSSAAPGAAPGASALARQDRLRFTPTSYAIELLELITTSLRIATPSKTVLRMVEDVSKGSVSDVTLSLVENQKLSDIEYATLHYSLIKIMSDASNASILQTFFASSRGRNFLTSMNRMLVCRGMTEQATQLVALAYANRLAQLSTLAPMASASVLQILPVDRVAAITQSPVSELTGREVKSLKAATAVLNAARLDQIDLFIASEIERSAETRFAFRALGYSAVVLAELSGNSSDRDSALNVLRLAERAGQIPSDEVKYRAVSYSLASTVYGNANRNELARSARFTAEYWRRQAPNPSNVFLAPTPPPGDRANLDSLRELLGQPAISGLGVGGSVAVQRPPPRLLPQIEGIWY